jgi:ribA/ribD-fused uncharacterized protein
MLKDSNIYVNEDYPRETERKRAILFPIMKRAKSIDTYESAYMVGDKLVINKVKYNADNLDALPNDLNPKVTSTQQVDGVTYFYTRNSPLSNHYMGAPFMMGETIYSCSEQRYFVAKASYLEDFDRIDGIMSEVEPHKILEEGKKIVNKNAKDWTDVEMHEMTVANRHKFDQNAGARAALMATWGTKLAECSPSDIRWGIGHAMHSKDRLNQMKWGANQMGAVLTILRDEVHAKQEAAAAAAAAKMQEG